MNDGFFDRFQRVFDFGFGWAELGFRVSPVWPGVSFRLTHPGSLNAADCRKLSAWLCHAADMLDAYHASSDGPHGTVVYVITDGTAHHKVGKAVSFKKRLQQLQTGNGRPLTLVAYLPCDSEGSAFIAERAVKRSLSEYQAVGEWFKCNSHYAFQALQEAAFECNLEWAPVAVNVGHDDEEATDGTHP